MVLPPRGSTMAIFFDNTPSFFIFIQKARPPHKSNKPKKPEKNAFPVFCGTNRATSNEAIATLHQGKNNPLTKARKAVNSIATINFILDLLIVTVNQFEV
jgi:hypothetical protein